MLKSAVLMPNWIGDFILALSAVKRKASSEDISLIVPSHLMTLARLLSDYKCISYERITKVESKNSVKNVASCGFSKLYLLPHSFSSAWFGFKTKIPHRRGIKAELRSLLLTECLSFSLATRKKHLLEEYSAVLGVPFEQPELWTGYSIKPSPDYSNAVVLCPGAAYGPAKKWPYYAELVNKINAEVIVILGDKRDQEDADHIANIYPQKTISLAGRTSLEQAARIIAGAKVVISNDSGLMHLAGFLGRPTIGIFGSTTPVWTRPLGSKTRIATIAYECSPCFNRTCKFDHYKCLKELRSETVLALVEDLVKG